MKHSCYFIICFWIITGFIIQFYITFGTNLLTGGPAHIAILLPVLVFRRKGITNGVQTEWNLRQRDFLEDYHPGDLEFTSEDIWGAQEIGPPLLGAPPCIMASSMTPRLALQVSWIIIFPKIMLLKVSFCLDSVWYSFSSKYWNRQ